MERAVHYVSVPFYYIVPLLLYVNHVLHDDRDMKSQELTVASFCLMQFGFQVFLFPFSVYAFSGWVTLGARLWNQQGKQPSFSLYSCLSLTDMSNALRESENTDRKHPFSSCSLNLYEICKLNRVITQRQGHIHVISVKVKIFLRGGEQTYNSLL